MNFETPRAWAPESPVVWESDVTAALANLPPIRKNLHRSENSSRYAERAAGFTHPFSQHETPSLVFPTNQQTTALGLSRLFEKEQIHI
jgi:hypothetical protein